MAIEASPRSSRTMVLENLAILPIADLSGTTVSRIDESLPFSPRTTKTDRV